jgi:uncharacterized membrane protein
MSTETISAIAVMAAVTAITRLAGLFVPTAFARRGRLGAAFQAMPVAVLVAIIAPTVLVTGWAETASAALVAVMAWRFPAIAAVVVGVLAVSGLRLLALSS